MLRQYRQLKKQIQRAEDELVTLDEEQQADPTAESTAVRVDSHGELDLECGNGITPASPKRISTAEAAVPSLVASPDASDFSHVDSEAPLRRRASVASGLSVTSAGLLRRIQLRRGTSGLTPAGDFNPKKWRKPFRGDMSISEILDVCESLPAPQSTKFIAMLDRELHKTSTFYEDREADAVRRFEDLSLQWRELAGEFSLSSAVDEPRLTLPLLSQITRRSSRSAGEDCNFYLAALTSCDVQAFRAREMNPPQFMAPLVNRVPQLPGSNLVRRTLAGRKPQAEAAANPGAHSHEASDGNCFTHGRPEDYTAARSKLKLASEYHNKSYAARSNLYITAFEYYRSLGMLKSYRVLNRTGKSAVRFMSAALTFSNAHRVLQGAQEVRKGDKDPVRCGLRCKSR